MEREQLEALCSEGGDVGLPSWDEFKEELLAGEISFPSIRTPFLFAGRYAASTGVDYACVYGSEYHEMLVWYVAGVGAPTPHLTVVVQHNCVAGVHGQHAEALQEQQPSLSVDSAAGRGCLLEAGLLLSSVSH